MKNIFLFFVAALVLTSCSKSEENVQEVMEQSVSMEKIPVERKVVSVMHAMGRTSYATVSVAYLLLDNDSVIVYADRVSPPFTPEQARVLMKAQLGDTVTVTCFE